MLDFLGIGAQKSGTTWLYEALAAHPDVRFPGGKELHFWNGDRARGVAWYRGLFEEQAPGKKCGEITPAYAMLPAAVVAEIAAINRALRILYILRNPIERAWSSALMALGRAELTLDEASDRWFVDHFRSRGSLARGDYETCLRTWRGEFDAGQLLVLRYEMLCDDPLGFVQACCRHIGVDPRHYERARPAILEQRAFSGPGVPIRDSLLPELREIYRPRVESLARFLGADLSNWLSR
jgi:hypothetical protein